MEDSHVLIKVMGMSHFFRVTVKLKYYLTVLDLDTFFIAWNSKRKISDVIYQRKTKHDRFLVTF